MSDLRLLLAAAALVVVAGLFAMTEAALSGASRARAAELARDGVPGARALQAVAADAPRHLNLLLLLRLTFEMVATTLVALVAVDRLGVGWRAALLAAGSMAVVSFVAVGVAPRTVGRQHAYTVGRLTAPAVRWLGRALGPLASLLILVGNAVTPGRGYREGPFATTVELRELVDLAEERGVVEHGEREMIHSVFALGSTIAREVMVPRTEMVWIEAHKTLRQALALALRSGFSRIPVIGENVDDVLGIVYLKDLIRPTTGGGPTAAVTDPRGGLGATFGGDGLSTTAAGVAAAGTGAATAVAGVATAGVATAGAGAATAVAGRPGVVASETPVEQIMRQAVFVPESKPVDDLLREMQAARTHIAIVVDEYGGTAGLVTIEDILEEIVGEITDEYDLAERPPVEWLRDGSVRVTARLPVEDLAELFGIELPTDEVETVAGLLAQALGRVPIPGAGSTVHGLSLSAEGATGRRNRIDTILVRPVGTDAPHFAGPGAPAGPEELPTSR